MIVTESPVRGDAKRALTLASQSADLIVVGAGRGMASNVGLGPVTTAMLHHAQCPVAVIPGSSLPWAAAPGDIGIARQTRAPASCVAT